MDDDDVRIEPSVMMDILAGVALVVAGHAVRKVLSAETYVPKNDDPDPNAIPHHNSLEHLEMTVWEVPWMRQEIGYAVGEILAVNGVSREEFEQRQRLNAMLYGGDYITED